MMSFGSGTYIFMKRNWSELKKLPQGTFVSATAPISLGLLIKLKNRGLVRKAASNRRYITWETTDLFWKVAEAIRRREGA